MKNTKIIKEKIDELFKEIDVTATDLYLIMIEIQKHYWFSVNYYDTEDVICLIEKYREAYDTDVYDKKVTLERVLSKIEMDKRQHKYDDYDTFVSMIDDTIDEILKETK